MIFRLNDDDNQFPDPRLCGEEDGLIAVGGDLSPDRLLQAYHYGIFPWYAFRGKEKLWYCPMQRFVIFPDEIHVSHSMRTLMNKGRYTVTANEDFDGVIRGCSEKRIDEEGAWLGEEMIEAYTRLHEMHVCSSVEVWDGEPHEGPLVGGLYGVDVYPIFVGESMFSRVPSASKLALILLAQTVKEKGGKLIDCQFRTPHLESMGGRFIPYEEYLAYAGIKLQPLTGKQ